MYTLPFPEIKMLTCQKYSKVNPILIKPYQCVTCKCSQSLCDKKTT